MKQPRPFYQLGDRVRSIDSYAGITTEYVINSMDETYTSENVITQPRLRAADAVVGAYDPANSPSESVIENQTDYSKLAETVDSTKGASSAEIRRDIYLMHGISYHTRSFDFTTGQYSGPAPPVAPPAGVVEFFEGELREYETPPHVIITPLFNDRAITAKENLELPAIFSYTSVVTVTGFTGNYRVQGQFTNRYGWYHWIAIGNAKRYIN